MTPEQVRLAHHQAEERARENAVPAPSPQPTPETHEQALMAAHQGTLQHERTCYP